MTGIFSVRVGRAHRHYSRTGHVHLTAPADRCRTRERLPQFDPMMVANRDGGVLDAGPLEAARPLREDAFFRIGNAPARALARLPVVRIDPGSTRESRTCCAPSFRIRGQHRRDATSPIQALRPTEPWRVEPDRPQRRSRVPLRPTLVRSAGRRETHSRNEQRRARQHHDSMRALRGGCSRGATATRPEIAAPARAETPPPRPSRRVD